MNHIRHVIILAVVALLPLTLTGQNAGAAAEAEQAGNNAAPQGNAVLRITSPHEGQRLKQSFVDVSYELTNPGASAAATPNFALRLDGRDPVTTTSTDYTFTGLAPGAHTISVQVVDANKTPIPGARSEVRFVVLRPTAGLRNGAQAVAAALRVQSSQPSRRDIDGEELPSAGGALPLLSVIGFGALLGGIASALKTR